MDIVDVAGNAFRNEHLVNDGTIIQPLYRNYPFALEANDRVFDPAIDVQTHSATKVGRIALKARFCHFAHPMTNIWIMLKKPQSDQYHLPRQLEQFREFVQKIANSEHNRTPAAFTRAATLYIRQGTGTTTGWHYDARPEDEYASWHYLACSKHPTIGMIMKFNDLAGVKKDGTFRPLYAATPLKELRQTPDSQLANLAHFENYDISRHGAMYLHHGTYANDCRDRTFVTISYIQVHGRDEYDFYPNPMLKKTHRVASLPPAEAGKRLQHHLSQK